MIVDTADRYTILEKIGEGGMGVVFRAHDERLDRDVALKVLPASIAHDAAARERLLREARTASRLNHPGICVVHDVGEAEGQIFVAMELIRGETLRALASAGPLPVESILRYGAQMATALGYAHERGVVHRDLKTANVVITSEGHAKILDFGLAVRRERGEAGDKTDSRLASQDAGSVAGTMAYLAPELLRGQPADERSDIWALGVILFELTAGQQPFRGDTSFELSSAILSGAPAALPASTLRRLRTVIQRCLTKEPRLRYQRASELLAALEALDSDSSTVLPARPRRARGGRIRSLAVLPLQNLTPDREQEYFTDGMTEALITELAKIAALRVISRTSVMRYKGVSKAVEAIAEELGVDAVVEGSVLRAGDRVRITAQLIHGTTAKHLWAESYDREFTEVLDLQREVTQTIAAQIHVKLTPREKARLKSPPRVSAEVYELYLKGRFHWNKLTVEDIRKGSQYFVQALQMDPHYAPGYAALADCYNALQFLGIPPSESAPRAREAALKAVELDPALAGAHSSLGTVRFFYDWDWKEAEKEFQRAIDLDPGSGAAYQNYSYLLTALGRHEDAITAMKRARDLDPLAMTINVDLGWRYYHARQYEHAIRQLRKTLELDPSFGNAYWCLGCAQVQLGSSAEGIASLQKAVALYAGNPEPKGSLGHAYGLSGRTEEAQNILKELEDLSQAAHVSPWVVAVVHAGMRNPEQSLEWLQRAYEERGPALVWLKVHPELDPLRSDPRLNALLDRMHFPE